MTTPSPTSTPSTRQPFTQVLTSVERNIDLPEWTIDSESLGLPSAAAVSISKRRLHGGRQEGVDLVRISTPQLAITIIPTRGMGVLRVEAADVRWEWNSPIKQVTHPHFVNLESRGGLGWLEGFNEWLVRCGLEFAGGPGKDKFVTNTGAEAEMDLTLHGKIANRPASELELVVDRVPPFAIRLRGRVDEVMFYGPKLELWTELYLEPNSTAFRIQDTVTNRGGEAQEFELIYHINYGAPLLEAGARFSAPIERVTPMNAHAAEGLAGWNSYAGPTQGFVEQVYCLRTKSGSDGKTTVMLKNAAADRAASITYPVSSLPCFTLWKNTNRLEEGCVTGLEPGTNFPNNRRIERKAGRLSKLLPGESRQFQLEFAVHSSIAEVQEAQARIDQIQGTQKPVIDPKPAGVG